MACDKLFGIYKRLDDCAVPCRTVMDDKPFKRYSRLKLTIGPAPRT